MRYLLFLLVLLQVGGAAAEVSSFGDTSWQPLLAPGAQLGVAVNRAGILQLEVINGYGGVERHFSPRAFGTISFKVQSSDFSAMTIRLIDETGQYHQQDLALSGDQWQTISLDSHCGDKYLHWNGADDGVWHGKLIGISFLVQTGFVRSQLSDDYFHGKLQLRDLRLPGMP